MMKNAFYFILQTLFVPAIFTFLPGLFGYIEKRFDKKAMLFSKFIMPRTVQLRITIHISPNISKSKGKQTMKFGQIIENNMVNIFLEKSYTKCVGEACSRPFYEKSKLSVYLDQQFDM